MKAILKMRLQNWDNNLRVPSLKIVLSILLLLPSFIVVGNTFTKPSVSGFITINVHYKEARPNDTLTLIIDEVLHNGSGIESDNLGSYKAVEHNGKFRFLVPVQQPCGYFDIITDRTFTKGIGGAQIMSLINPCFWEIGDNVAINISHKETPVETYSTCSFSGKGAHKYEVEQLTDSIVKATVVTVAKPVFDTAFRYFDFYPGKCKKALDILEQNKTKLSDLSYQVLKANILYRNSRGRFPVIWKYYDEFIKSAPPNVKEKFRSKLNKTLLINDPYHISEIGLLNSRGFIQYTYYKFKTLSLINNDEDNEQLVFNLMKQKLSGAMRDKEFIFLFLNYPHSSAITDLYSEAREIIHDDISLKIFNDLERSAPGKHFFNFSLPDTSGKIVDFSEFKGRTVLIDFWYNGCGACAAFYQNTLKEIEHAFDQDKKVVFISINSDKTKGRWLQGISTGIYTSSDAINLYTNELGWNHPLIVSNNIQGFPFVFLVDKNGFIRYSNSDNLYNYQGLAKAIKSIE
jgi:thiol-disulfide isomerase/thioredoxin